MRVWLINELLLWLIITNGAPLLLALILGRRASRPLDAGRLLPDRRPLFGTSKTLRGIAAAIIASTLAAPLFDHDFLTGAAFGSLAMLGDLLSSFIKRRLGLQAGGSLPLVDQVPECMLPLVVLQPVLAATALEILAATVGFIVIDLLAAQVIRPDQPAHR